MKHWKSEDEALEEFGCGVERVVVKHWKSDGKSTKNDCRCLVWCGGVE